MGKISGFIRKAKELGISGAVKHGFKKVTGIRKNEEQIDTLYYFLNHIVDITSIKPAEGALRKLQLCDAALLNVFDAICEREGWTYWLSFGTLLGAVRHKGFIPWDDDTDVSMPREDYDDAVQRLPGIFASYGNDSISCNVSEPARIGMGYRHLKTGVWCDIFPVDEVYSTDSTETAKKELAGRMRKYSAFCNKKGRNLGSDELASERTKYTNILGGGGHNLACEASGFSQNIYLHEWDTLLPARTIQFEGFNLKAPRNIQQYLTATYGDYMLFPRDGTEHHDLGRGPLSGWAERNGIDMDEVLAKLEDMEKFFRSQV